MFGQSSCIEIITTKFLKKLKNVLFHDVFGQVWTSLDKFGRVWTSLDKFGRVWTSLDELG